MGEPAASPTYCPINGIYSFTYSVNDGTENSLECSYHTSELADCPYGFGFNLKFKGCSFGDMGKQKSLKNVCHQWSLQLDLQSHQYRSLFSSDVCFVSEWITINMNTSFIIIFSHRYVVSLSWRLGRAWWPEICCIDGYTSNYWRGKETKISMCSKFFN